jgi:hypothetical protein
MVFRNFGGLAAEGAMSTITETAGPATKQKPTAVNWFSANWGLLEALAALVLILLVQTPEK